MSYYASTSVDFSKKEFNQTNNTKIDHNLLRKLLRIQSPSGKEEPIISFVLNYIKQLNDPTIKVEIDKVNNLMITKGESSIYPCFVAHMDSVNSIQSNRTVMRLNNCYIGINLNTGEFAAVDGDR